jgi:hypothetical protein
MAFTWNPNRGGMCRYLSRRGSEMITDKQKIRVLKQTVRDLRACLEESSIDSSACLMGENPDALRTKAEEAWILKEYRAGRL